jgi:putative transposase
MADKTAGRPAVSIQRLILVEKCLMAEAARPYAIKVVAGRERLARIRGVPRAITVDHRAGFCSRAVDAWAYQAGVKLDFIRPGKPAENGFIESINGRLLTNA